MLLLVALSGLLVMELSPLLVMLGSPTIMAEFSTSSTAVCATGSGWVEGGPCQSREYVLLKDAELSSALY